MAFVEGTITRNRVGRELDVLWVMPYNTRVHRLVKADFHPKSMSACRQYDIKPTPLSLAAASLFIDSSMLTSAVMKGAHSTEEKCAWGSFQQPGFKRRRSALVAKVSGHHAAGRLKSNVQQLGYCRSLYRGGFASEDGMLANQSRRHVVSDNGQTKKVGC